MLKMVDGTGIIGVDMICPLGVSTPQPPNYDRVELEGAGMLVLPNSLDAPLERLELGGKTEQVQTSGKNLLNIPFIDGGVRETPIQCNFEKPILIHAETLPKSIQSNAWRIKVVYKDNTLKYVIDSDMQKGSLFDASPENPIVSINYRGLYITEGRYEKIQVEYGARVTPYEPYTGGKPSPSPEYPQEIKNVGKWNEETQKYEVDVKITNAEQNWSKEQTLTITSDRPITKWDKLVEQGGQIGWLYGSVIATIDETADISLYAPNGFFIHVKNIDKKEKTGYCDKLYTKKMSNGEPFVLFGIANNNFLYTLNTQEFYGKTASEIKAKLKEYPLNIIGKSETTEFVPLQQSEQNAIRALKTYYSTTVITVDGGEVDPDIKVTYRKEI